MLVFILLLNFNTELLLIALDFESSITRCLLNSAHDTFVDCLNERINFSFPENYI